jgi:hypothetical protein
MRRPSVRRSLAAGAATVIFTMGATIAGAGAADASTAPGAPVPLRVTVLNSCAATVPDAAGQTIAVTPISVIAPVDYALAPLDPLNAITPTFQAAWLALPPIPIGSTAGTGQPQTIAGPGIASAVVNRLTGIPVLSPVLDVLLPKVWATLSATCGVLVRTASALNPAPGNGSQPTPTSPAPSTDPAPGGSQPTGPADPTAAGQPVGQPGSGPALCTCPQGIPGDVGLGLPLDSLRYNESGTPPQIDLNALRLEQQRAGHAEPLANTDQMVINRAILFAVLLTALVAAQLARTWVLRRGLPRRPAVAAPATAAGQVHSTVDTNAEDTNANDTKGV